MRRFLGTLLLLLVLALVTPWGQRLVLHQIPAWSIRDGGFVDPPDRVVQVGDLQGYYFAPAPGQPTLFFAHGNSSRLARQVQRLAPALETGMGLYYVTYPGFDANLTRPADVAWGWMPQFYSEAGARQALRDHWAAYLRLGGDPGRTILTAESLGTALLPGFARALPADQKPPLMVILAGFDEYANVVRAKTFGLIGGTLLYDDYDNTGVWEALTIPTFVANGDADWMVSEARGRAVVRRMTGRRHFQLYEGFGHLDLPLGQGVLDALEHNFRDRLALTSKR